MLMGEKSCSVHVLRLSNLRSPDELKRFRSLFTLRCALAAACAGKYRRCCAVDFALAALPPLRVVVVVAELMT